MSEGSNIESPRPSDELGRSAHTLRDTLVEVNDRALRSRNRRRIPTSFRGSDEVAYLQTKDGRRIYTAQARFYGENTKPTWVSARRYGNGEFGDPRSVRMHLEATDEDLKEDIQINYPDMTPELLDEFNEDLQHTHSHFITKEEFDAHGNNNYISSSLQ